MGHILGPWEALYASILSSIYPGGPWTTRIKVEPEGTKEQSAMFSLKS